MAADSNGPGTSLLSLGERLQGVCLGRRLTVAAAESCTGGRISAAITAVPGSSGYFLGAVVSYADGAKVALLGVGADAIAEHGAVSAQVARSMARGARERFGADLAVSVTGIAGPSGGTPAKPVGLAYLGLDAADGSDVRRFVFAGDRGSIQEAVARAALEWLIERAEGAP